MDDVGVFQRVRKEHGGGRAEVCGGSDGSRGRGVPTAGANADEGDGAGEVGAALGEVGKVLKLAAVRVYQRALADGAGSVGDLLGNEI